MGFPLKVYLNSQQFYQNKVVLIINFNFFNLKATLSTLSLNEGEEGERIATSPGSNKEVQLSGKTTDK